MISCPSGNCLRQYQPKSVSNHPRDIGLPMLPGNNFHDDPISRQTLHKSHSLGMNRSVAQDLYPKAKYDYINPLMLDGSSSSLTKCVPLIQQRETRNRIASNVTSCKFPLQQHKESASSPLDDESVLQFLAYFKEGLSETVSETVRIRRVAIIFHCADDTILIREANQINSGIPQGVIMRRSKLSNYQMEDFFIGAEIIANSVTYRIVDMSEFTRHYLKKKYNLDTDEPLQALPWPNAEDNFNTQFMPKHLQHNPKKSITTVDMDRRRQMEFAVAGSMSKHHPDDVHAAQQFLTTKLHQNLQFAVIWDDRATKHGDCRLFVLKYYIENDTVEVVEVRKDNDGRDTTGNKLVGRMRVLKPINTKTDMALVDHQHDTFGMKLKSHYLTAREDLYVGASLEIHNKSFLLYDADEATRLWYKEKYNIVLKDKIDVQHILDRDLLPPTVHTAPPYNGYGNEADSLQNWKYILLRNPKADVHKIAKEDGKLMRFVASLAPCPELGPEDQGRVFVINYYRVNDTVEVVEQQIKNSGFIGGKFLSKNAHTVGGKRVYHPEDFVEGAIVEIQGRKFLLEEMDELSKKMMRNYTAPTSAERLRNIITQLRDAIGKRYFSTREAFRMICPGGYFTVEILTKFLSETHLHITPEEASSVIQHYVTLNNNNNNNKNDDACYWDYKVFRDAVDFKNSFYIDDMVNRPCAVGGIQISDATQISNSQCLSKSTNELLRKKELTEMLREKFRQKKGNTHELFRLLAGSTPDATLEEEEFRYALIHILHFNLEPKDMEVMVKILFPPPQQNRKVTLREFCNFVDGKSVFLKSQ